MVRKAFSIAIDPGKSTGFAVYDRSETKLIDVRTLDFWTVIGILSNSYHPKKVHKLLIEIPKTKHVWHKQAKTRGAIERTGVNVGSSIREAELLIEWAMTNGYNVVPFAPQGKATAKYFNACTGWEGRTSQHARDAGMMVYGV